MSNNQLLQSLTMGGKPMKNSFVFGPHRLNFPEGHLPGAKRIAYYEERAKHDVGMIITEGSQVLAGEYPYDWALNLHEPDAVKAYGKLAARIKQYGTVLVGQLNLYGGQGESSVTRRPLLAPSPMQEVNTNEVAKAMTHDDINQVLAGFVLGAEVLLAADFDGVEINMGQYSLLRQFASGLTNFRQDEYGGSLENRCRLPLEVLQKVRAKTKGKILGLRLVGDEYAPWGGLTPEDAGEIGAYLAKQVDLDYIAIENGSLYSTNMTFGGYNQPEDYTVAAARIVANTLQAAGLAIPICVGGSLVSPELIGKTLEEFAMVDATRALIADPQYLHKLANGKEAEIVPCILCKDGCQNHGNTNAVISCSVNPRVGIEHQTVANGQTKRIAVVGGGPAGINAALAGAANKQKITLYEKRNCLGGKWQDFADNFSSPMPRKLLDYYERALSLAGVELRLNTAPTADELATYDGVIIATGSTYGAKSYQGNAKTVSLENVLVGDFPQGKPCVVVDSLGDNRTIVACRKLAAAGCKITLVTLEPYIAGKLVKLGEFGAWYGEMAALGIVECPSTDLHRADQEKLILVNKYTEQYQELPGVDFVVDLSIPEVNQELWQAIQHSGINCICIGDSLAPRGLRRAVSEGYMATIKL